MTGRVCDLGQLMPVDEAISHLLEQAPPPPLAQKIGLDQALGRVLAADIHSPVNLPAWDNSAMDGYALRAADLPPDGGYLAIGGRIAAGDQAKSPLLAQQAVQIFTGEPPPLPCARDRQRLRTGTRRARHRSGSAPAAPPCRHPAVMARR